MSMNAIARIKQAESQAANTVELAKEAAAAKRAEQEAKGIAYCEEVTRKTEAEIAAQLKEVEARAEMLAKKKEAEAQKEAADMIAAAREHMDAAIKLIVWGIVEKCQ